MCGKRQWGVECALMWGFTIGPPLAFIASLVWLWTQKG